MRLLSKRPKIYIATQLAEDLRCEFHLVLKSGEQLKPYQHGMINQPDRYFLYKSARRDDRGFYQIIDVYGD